MKKLKFKLLLVVFVITSLLAAPAAATELGKAPESLPWPDGLPLAVDQADGTFLPTALATEVVRHLLYGDRYPELCQQSIDEYAGVVQLRDAVAFDIERAKYDAQIARVQADAENGWHWYHVAGAVLGGLALGLTAGYVAGH